MSSKITNAKFGSAVLAAIAACGVWPALAVAQSAPPTRVGRANAGNAADTPESKAVVEGNNAFAVNLYGQLKSRSGNLFFSPESISTALAMTYAGARGETATQMAKAMDFTLPAAKLAPAMGALLRDMNAPHESYQLQLANALWAQQGTKLREDFLSQLKADYGAGVERLDFKTATEASRQTINTWVAQKTADKITNLIAPGVLTPKTRLVLTNAIYFKGAWQTQFDKADTRIEDFHLSATKSVKVPLMHREGGGFLYLDGGTFQALEIPYKGRELSLILLLPREIDGLPALESQLTPANAKQWIEKLEPLKKVIVTMPRFKVTQEFELKDALSALGMPLAFKNGSADFSGMTDEKPGFVISAVIHKAYVDVNEQGTEAAAATAVVMMGAMAAMRPPPPPPVFRADHPFVFLIRDNTSGGILFMGRVENPE